MFGSDFEIVNITFVIIKIYYETHLYLLKISFRVTFKCDFHTQNHFEFLKSCFEILLKHDKIQNHSQTCPQYISNFCCIVYRLQLLHSLHLVIKAFGIWMGKCLKHTSFQHKYFVALLAYLLLALKFEWSIHIQIGFLLNICSNPFKFRKWKGWFDFPSGLNEMYDRFRIRKDVTIWMYNLYYSKPMITFLLSFKKLCLFDNILVRFIVYTLWKIGTK